MAYCYITKTFVARNEFHQVKVACNTDEKIGQAWTKLLQMSLSNEKVMDTSNILCLECYGCN